MIIADPNPPDWLLDWLPVVPPLVGSLDNALSAVAPTRTSETRLSRQQMVASDRLKPSLAMVHHLGFRR